MSIVIINGERLNYQVHHGAPRPSGPPLVFVHGAGGNLMHWPTQLRRLPEHTIYTLDLPGHGKSVRARSACPVPDRHRETGPSGRSEVGAYTEVVRDFAEALGLSPFVLGGHSMGGAIAQEFALRYTNRLAGLVLIGTGARLRVAPQFLDGVLKDPQGTAELLATWAHGEHVDPNLRRIYIRRLREVNPQVIHGDFVACDAFDRMADVARIALPTLVICGDADRMTPVKYSRFLAEQIKRAQLVVVPEAGHMVMLERPEAVIEAIGRFLASLVAL
jgi:pimeloyl-ACP methyl ester carboxylesterase